MVVKSVVAISALSKNGLFQNPALPFLQELGT
jgi:hypothetical protein